MFRFHVSFLRQYIKLGLKNAPNITWLVSVIRAPWSWHGNLSFPVLLLRDVILCPMITSAIIVLWQCVIRQDSSWLRIICIVTRIFSIDDKEQKHLTLCQCQVSNLSISIKTTSWTFKMDTTNHTLGKFFFFWHYGHILFCLSIRSILFWGGNFINRFVFPKWRLFLPLPQAWVANLAEGSRLLASPKWSMVGEFNKGNLYIGGVS